MSAPGRALPRCFLALLVLPWHVLPAAAQTRVAPVELPPMSALGAAAALTPAVLPSAPRSDSSPLALSQSFGTTPSIAIAASATPSASAGPLAAAKATTRAGTLPLASSLASAGPAAPARRANRFQSAALTRILGELARFAAPLPPASVLAPAGAAAETPRTPSEVGVEPGKAPPPVPIPGRRRLRDAWLYSKIYMSSLYWYTGPRLLERWAEIREKLAEAGDRPRAVKDIKGFFIAHRVLGSTGNYSPLGFRVASTRLVIHDALAIYERYFVPDDGARAAFLALMARAERFNPNRRSTQYRKALFHALREASVLEPSKVAAFFDSQLGPDKAARLEQYQRTEQPRVLAAFDTAVNEVIAEMNFRAPAGERIVGALLLGSFANGAAGPGSDLDVQALAENGSTRYNDDFIKRLKARWKQETWTDSPVSSFQYAMPLSKPLISRVHREPYLIFSPYRQVTVAMTRTAAEERADQPSKIRTIRGWLFQQVYSVLLRVVLGIYDLKAR